MPAQELAAGTIISRITFAHGDRRTRRSPTRWSWPTRRARRSSPAASPARSCRRHADRPLGHRAAGRPRISRRGAAEGQARDHHPDQRGRRAERPGAARRPGGHHPDLHGRRYRRRVGRRSAPARPCSTNIRVLALDQRLAPAKTEDDKGKTADAPPVAQTATLEVTPREAEMITLARPRQPLAGAELGARRRRRRRGAGRAMRRPAAAELDHRRASRCRRAA